MVNGEPIYLHSLETLLDSRSSAYGRHPQADLEDMQKDYAHALGVLLTYALVRQELEQRGIQLPDKGEDPAIRDLNEEMGEPGLEGFLTEASIRRDDWQQLMSDYQALETFRNQVLLPNIKIELEEIRDYYAKHKDDFRLPAHIRACFLNAAQREELEALCDRISEHNILDSTMALCADMENGMLPSPWLEEQATMKLNSCGKFRHENDVWKTVAILSRSPGRAPKLAEIYALIEKIILEEKQQAAFDKWLADKVAASSIIVAPELNQSLSLGREDGSENAASGG